ncbi:lysophospholipid acyltransferase family protein [Paraburkholderia sp. NMBU_R16]|uniref:lysophospholipid acyltransferase family protein n=1 Tax=Paraburkholderia sp. NMBU_R16 TaxID=2698676 RepID=UPI00349F951E
MSYAGPPSTERVSIDPVSRGLEALRQYVVFYLGLLLLAIACLGWLPFAALLRVLLPRHVARTLGRAVIQHVWRLYFHALSALGAARFDLSELATLRGKPAMILAPNHPTLIDAMLIAACVPRVCCVMKGDIADNVFLGAGARLADYIVNDAPKGMIKAAVDDLRRGHPLLLFPEGTRTESPPVNPLKAGIGLVAARASVPVQTLIVEAGSPFLAKGWHILRKPVLPLNYRVRLGRRFAPPQANPDAVRSFVAQLHAYYEAELSNDSPAG